jgi:hypothetical protein
MSLRTYPGSGYIYPFVNAVKKLLLLNESIGNIDILNNFKLSVIDQFTEREIFDDIYNLVSITNGDVNNISKVVSDIFKADNLLYFNDFEYFDGLCEEDKCFLFYEEFPNDAPDFIKESLTESGKSNWIVYE